MATAELTPYLLGLPEVIASRYAEKDTWLHDELVGRGTLALVEAMASYDPSYGTTLNTHSWWQIYGAVTHGVRRCHSGTSLGRHWATLSLDVSVGVRRGGDSRCGAALPSRIACLPSHEPAPHTAADDREVIDRLLAYLEPLDRRIVWMYHGLDYTMQEIGAALDPPLSGSRVQQRLRKAEARLRRVAAELT